ncbi:hypothetical protein JTB14_027977 [Gonioctena quinquepunctata]|nr:hypothetical protein JTB14_027977 [Gonioctena quinquepunctata]
MITTVLNAADKRNDEKAQEVRLRLSGISDLVAADGVYHLVCYQQFVSHKPPEEGRKRGFGDIFNSPSSSSEAVAAAGNKIFLELYNAPRKQTFFNMHRYNAFTKSVSNAKQQDSTHFENLSKLPWRMLEWCYSTLEEDFDDPDDPDVINLEETDQCKEQTLNILYMKIITLYLLDA